MNEQWKAILENKRTERSRLAALPFSEKIVLLEKLRDRAAAAAGSALYCAREPSGKACVLRERPPKDGP